MNAHTQADGNWGGNASFLWC